MKKPDLFSGLRGLKLIMVLRLTLTVRLRPLRCWRGLLAVVGRIGEAVKEGVVLGGLYRKRRSMGMGASKGLGCSGCSFGGVG